MYLEWNHVPVLISVNMNSSFPFSQPAVTCLKLTIETLEQGVKYVQN